MTFTTTHTALRLGRPGATVAHPLPMRRAPRAAAKDELRVTLHRNECGAVVVVDEHQVNGPHVLIVAAFTGSSPLEDWCACDPLRFSAPIVLEQVRRDVETLLHDEM